MVGLKFLVIAALVALAAGSPAPNPQLAGLVRMVLTPKPWWPAAGAAAAATGLTHALQPNVAPLAALGFLANGLGGTAVKAAPILLGLAALRSPGSLHAAIHTIIGIAMALGHIINHRVPGLGILLGVMAIATFKILLCVHSSQSGSGGLGQLAGGLGEIGKGIPGICDSGFGKNFGCQPYHGGYDSPDDIIKHFKLGNSTDLIQELVQKATHGKGMSALPASLATIVKILLELTPLFKHGGHAWASKDITKVVVAVASILGIVGNGYRPDGYGHDLVHGFLDYLSPIFKSHGLDLSDHEKGIKDLISKFGKYRFGGALGKSDDDGKDNDDDHDEGISGNDDGDESKGLDGQDNNDNSDNDKKDNDGKADNFVDDIKGLLDGKDNDSKENCDDENKDHDD